MIPINQKLGWFLYLFGLFTFRKAFPLSCDHLELSCIQISCCGGLTFRPTTRFLIVLWTSDCLYCIVMPMCSSIYHSVSDVIRPARRPAFFGTIQSIHFIVWLNWTEMDSDKGLQSIQFRRRLNFFWISLIWIIKLKVVFFFLFVIIRIIRSCRSGFANSSQFRCIYN